jgi:His-Xaa-Ser system protein HxsD
MFMGNEIPNHKDVPNIDIIDVNTVKVHLQTQIYRLSAIKKAAYQFADKSFIHIVESESASVTVEMKRKSHSIDMGDLAGSFCNEVLDQELRELVAQETEPIRNLLLAQAFSCTSLIDPSGEAENYQEDPKEILPSTQEQRNSHERDRVS